ncbi:hypothetical protein [Longimicrobium sp.]|uniref:hypothetical protein n=1 Tax=Longimicrobium sp. TaxID=2029185 RepID=UPI003B3AAF89
MRPLHLALAALLALQTACAPQAGPRPVPPVQDPCAIPSWATLVMAERDIGMAPGESQTLAPPVVHHGPSGPRSVDEGCSIAWAVEGTGAQIDAVGTLAIAPDARPGDSLYVVARAMGDDARARVKIVAPGPNPLAGTWRQVRTPTCVGPGGPIGELVLRRSGGMMLTVRPFETYVDLAGTYTLDPATSLLELRSSTRAVDGGLFLAGYARVEGDSLEIRLAPGGDRVGLFATMPGEEECRATFQRAGAAR